MQLRLATSVIDVEFLPFDVFHGEFGRARFAKPNLGDAFGWEAYFDEKHDTEGQIREALSRQWLDVDEFEVGWDKNFAFTLCGAIYSPSLICRDYIELLLRILRTTRHYDCWTYNTSVELAQPLDGMTMCAFALQHHRVTVADWQLGKFDFVRYFSRSREEARAEAL